MKLPNYQKHAALIVVLMILFLVPKAAFAQRTAAGTIVFNFAEASYRDGENGSFFNTVSPLVSFSVRAVSALTVTPDESESSAIVTANETITRQFRVCNSGNQADSYVLTSAPVSAPAEIAGIYFDTDADNAVSNGDIPVAIGSTQSPTIEVGACIAVLVVVNTRGIAPNERLTIGITARSTIADAANGAGEDSGTIINIAGRAAAFSDPENPALPPLKLIENKTSYTASRNQPLRYRISFRNSGEVAALGVRWTDELPEGLQYIPNTLQINGRSVTDTADADEGQALNNRLSVSLTNPVAPDQIVVINFQAMITNALAPGAGIVNVAEISGLNAPVVKTTSAVAVVDPFGTVYAARGGAAARIAGARVAISTEKDSENLLPIPLNQGFVPNLANENPYLTNSDGRFSFGLRPEQLGALSSPETYFVSVAAADFRPRLIRISLSPNGNNLFKMIVRSLDAMPVAVANGFELTQNEVEIESIADVAFNIPMFENATLEVVKTADRMQAEIGDLINYRIELHNASIAPVFDAVLIDTLPASFAYAAGTARIERGGGGGGTAASFEPHISGNVMRFNLGEIAAGERLSITYRVRVGVNAREGENYNTASVSGRFAATGEIVQTAPSRVGVRVGAGIFSMRQIVVGRVFVDANGNQSFDKGEQPVAGARVYLAGGQSAITDSEGMYSLPAIEAGAQVIALDPVTLPEGYLLADNNSRAGKDWTRLLRAPLGGGAMLRQNFVLVESQLNPPLSGKNHRKNLIDSTKNINSEKSKNAKLIKAEYAAGGAANELAENTDDKTAQVEKFQPVAPGEVFVHALENNSVVMSPAVNLNISVAREWKVQVELNEQKFGEGNIGQTREDRANQITTYTFVGLGLKPGPNRLTIKAVSPNGETGNTVEMTLFGRGAARRLEIVAEKRELQASGRDSTDIMIRAFDEWEHPAQDASLMIQTSAGRLVKLEDLSANAEKIEDNRIVAGKNAREANGASAEQVNEIAQQQSINLTEGVGYIKLISDNRTGAALVKAVSSEKVASETEIRFTPEMRPAILVGLAEFTMGRAAPEMVNRGRFEEGTTAHVQFFYRGSLLKSRNLLTLGYDSLQPLNRVAGRDRLFQLNPLERAYPVFGDSSTRFQETESNSNLYLRVDRGRSYAMFGDFEADMEASRLAGYSRKLTGVKVHLENSKGDFLTVTGARPDTAFARQVIAGGSLSLVQLNYPDVLPGSEVLTVEIRDRRNPEIILSREILVRSLDYNIDPASGTVFFLRPIPAFDRHLNLVQIVAAYEHRSAGAESSVYTARASKNFNRLGMRLGFSFINQQQAENAPFRLGGIDASFKLPKRGKLEFEWAMSRGAFNNGFGFEGNNPSGGERGDGNAFFVLLEQPLPTVMQSVLKFEAASASENFYNPFGATVTPGTTRGAVSWEFKPQNKSSVRLNFIGERNSTANVDNNRITAGVEWSQVFNEKVRLNFGYDFRRFADGKTEDQRAVVSNLLTVGAEFKPTGKLEIGIKREQNIGGEADPSYPNQTTLTANYRASEWAKIFFTQRLASAPIVPIADLAETGFAASGARQETSIGIETNFGKYAGFSGRYQLENGANGTDSFAVVGLQNRLPIGKTFSIDFGFERAFHLKGNGDSYNNFSIGGSWMPTDGFRSSARYEVRTRDGFGQVLSFGAAGVLKPGWTTLARFQYGNISFGERINRLTDGQIAVAIRPHDTDRYGLLMSYTHRDSSLSGGSNANSLPTRLKTSVLSADAFYQATARLELYGRAALKLSGDGNTDLPYADSLTYLVQGRAQYRLARAVDIAAEGRYLYQPSGGSRRRSLGAEVGFWVLPELRLGAGYNFSRAQEIYGFQNNSVYNRNGFYFVVSSKLSRLFNLFGTSREGLRSNETDEIEGPPNRNLARAQK